jgi:hypothetical protein
MNYLATLLLEGAPYKVRLVEVSREYPLVIFNYKGTDIVQDLSKTTPNQNGSVDVIVKDAALQLLINQKLVKLETNPKKVAKQEIVISQVVSVVDGTKIDKGTNKKPLPIPLPVPIPSVDRYNRVAYLSLTPEGIKEAQSAS